MSDLIERNEAILNHCILECRKAPDGCEVDCAHYHLFKSIPAVEKRKKGKWIDNETSYADGVMQTCNCSECGRRSTRPLGDFCRWCGSYNGGENEV